MRSFFQKTLILNLIIAIAATFFVGNAFAIDFQKGELQGSWDTTISYGASWRRQDRDDALVGKANIDPSVLFLPNSEQRLAPGRWSVNSDDGNLAYDKGDLISHAIKLTTELGFSYRNFGGFVRAKGFYDFEYKDRNDLSKEAEDLVGSNAELLDAYLYFDFNVGDHNATTRFGSQVVSWGESTFIQGGINVINPVDVSAIRIAGAELKEALLPIDMVWGAFDLSENLTLEALYMFEFEQIEPDPAGTYFSVNDFATPGGEYVMLNFGLLNDDRLPDGSFPPGAVPRRNDLDVDDSGQYGVALRWFVPDLNFSEFGFYYLNYHSRLPLLSGFSVQNSSSATAGYRVEYPEDINLYGISLNTTLPLGISLGTELSYRDNVPLQFDDVELLFSALSPLNAVIPEPANRFQSQLGEVGVDEHIVGWERHEVSQFQFTLTKLFGPNNFLGANSIAFVTEFGATKVWDLPDKDILRYNGPGTDTAGGADILNGRLRNPITQEEGFADSFSWGYRLITRASYNNAFGSPMTLSPRIGFSHDVNGTSPGPGGNFIEDRKTLTVGVSGNYLQKWTADLNYTRYFGAGIFNLINDRDFISANVKYSF